MESVKKWLLDRNAKRNGVYVHYTPPKVVGLVSGAQLRQWARGSEESRLERAVIAGQGHRLLAETEGLYLSNHLPHLVAKCDALHAAVDKGSLLELQELLESDYNRRKYVMCRDEAGIGLLHKAIYYDFMDIAQYLVLYYPQLVNEKDSEGRTPLHYACMCRDEAAAAALLEGAGAVRGTRDAAGRTPAQYRGQARTLLTLPTVPPSDMARDNTRNPPGLVIKRHNIRIWCHECDMGRLQRVVWEGHGSRLLSEVSNQPVVKRFLEAVPYIMNTIRDIHSSVINNDLEGLMKHAGNPVPPQALSSRDANNMTVLHKAAGLGHSSIMKYVVERYPQGINDIDNDGRTPLHYAAAMRDEQHTYNTLVGLGADESIVDNKNRTPAYYINRPQDIDKNLFKTVPEAPRTPSSAYPSNWDWKLLDTGVITELNKKSRRRNLKASSENISSKNNTNTVSDTTDCTGVMKASSTHEHIKNLPDLDDKPISKNNDLDHHDEHEQNNIDSNAGTEEKDEEDKSELSAEKPTEKTEDKPDEETKENPAEAAERKHDEEIQVDESESKLPTDTEECGKDNNEELKMVKEQTNDITNEDAPGVESDVLEESIKNRGESDNENKDENIFKETEQESKDADDVEDKKVDLNNEIENEENVDTKNEVDNVIERNINNEEELKSEINEEKITNVDTEIKESNTNDKEDCIDRDIYANEDISNENKTAENESNELNHDGEKADEKTQNADGFDTTDKEGNINEDDDDVQIPRDVQSDYSDFNQKSTAEISDGSAKRGNAINGRSTQESLIEGFVNGKAEQDSQDASISKNDASVHEEVYVIDSEIDPEVTDLINNSNMEMLATLVLNGEGSRLIGRRSENIELQTFLDNVPTYMQKINKVHVAAREGNIRDLQAALDRRKFAIARDPISPNGATPLHVATVFGKTNIIKYLGGRFPETLSAVDYEGRTALHYAAVLPDNDHYYNLIQQLGANSKDLDDNGRSAEEYHQNPNLLPFDQLLTDFGISKKEVQSMFTDKDTARFDNSHMDIPIFHTEEGRYLAKCKLPINLLNNKMSKFNENVYLNDVFTALGDPLIKGLTEVANVKPKDPVAFLASFLHNFPEQEKSHLRGEELEVVMMKEAGEVENEQAPPLDPEEQPTKVRSAARTATRPHRPIDVVTVDPQPIISPDAPETAFSSINRDEHGQSMLHFAAARTHARNALFQLLQESDISLGYRDELYRTARDVSIQANVPENTAEIDKWVLHMAARGSTDKIMELLLEGYDHILDVVDEDGLLITKVMEERGLTDMSDLLASIPAFEETRETLHGAVRRGDLASVQELLSGEGANTLARSRNSFGRSALHIAVLAQHEEVVAYLAENFPELLRIGDNLERTPLHYAMGVDKIESLSRVLIRAGAKRVLKDLKGRQPSYYFMNKSDILRLKEEEEVY